MLEGWRFVIIVVVVVSQMLLLLLNIQRTQRADGEFVFRSVEEISDTAISRTGNVVRADFIGRCMGHNDVRREDIVVDDYNEWKEVEHVVQGAQK